MIKLSGIKKSFSNRFALDIDELVFEKGTRYAVIGANGSGKSTLLRVLAGIIKPDCGELAYENEMPEHMGYMPQQPYAYGFSTLKNIMIALHSQENAEQNALIALEKVGMGHLAREKGNRLSGGETQRMALARMIALKRPLLLLDEPTSATDIAGNDRIEGVLLDFCLDVGSTLIFSTHSLAQARRVAEYVIMLDRGRVVESGTVEQVLLQPKSEEARLFLKHWRLG